MSAPVVTVAIPCRDAGPYLRPLLESLLAQSRQDFALMLLDDRSRDGSPALAKQIGGDRILVIENGRQLGLGGNFARCASLVRTPFFCLAHQDDVYERDWLARMIALLEQQPRAGIAHCPAQAIDAHGNVLASPAERYKAQLAPAATDDLAATYRQLWRGNFVCCPSVLYRTEAYRAVGGFTRELVFAVDWELWFRLLRGGFAFAYERTPLLRYRRHERAASRESTRLLTRFLEELAVVDRARDLGIAAGLLPASLAGAPSPALRNGLLHEAFEDLRLGDHAAVEQKLAFLRERVPALWQDPFVRTFRGLSRLGAPGRALLGAGRAVAVRFGLGAAAR